ncbi:MAG: YfhO family protein, partial [Oscillospiraceae bacterium]|nr:YfhO family protein [Oscillospiraceae bacterium]
SNEPGWTVYVDGAETEITELYDALIGVPITAGTHTVEMKYFPPGLKVGIIITFLGAAAIVLIGICENKRRMAVQTVQNTSAEQTETEE